MQREMLFLQPVLPVPCNIYISDQRIIDMAVERWHISVCAFLKANNQQFSPNRQLLGVMSNFDHHSCLC